MPGDGEDGIEIIFEFEKKGNNHSLSFAIMTFVLTVFLRKAQRVLLELYNNGSP